MNMNSNKLSLRNVQVVNQRLEIILDHIYTNGFSGIGILAEQLCVSEMTIRRDFEKLESQGLIRRTHGGAVAEQKNQIELNYQARQRRHSVEKEAIGLLAAGLVKPGQSIFLDAGTTVLSITKFIKRMKSIQVVTCSLTAHNNLLSAPEIEVILVGGKVFAHSMSLVGTVAQDNIANMRFDWAFLGTGGIDFARGLTHSTTEEIPIKRAAAASASKVAVLADSTKFGNNALSLIMPIQQFDIIVTEKAVENVEKQLLHCNPKAMILWPGKIDVNIQK
jgi:DeoR family fructose operon transcriptional repressor